jgi:hypothetical protein
MSRCLKTTYSMLGLNGRVLRAAPPPPPQPEPEPQPDADYSSDDVVDPRFAVWHETYIADAEAEAAQWGEQPHAPADPEQAAILASLNTQPFRRLKEEEREFVNDANLKHTLEISHQRAAT